MSDKFLMGAVVGFAAAYLLLNAQKKAGSGGVVVTQPYYPDTPATPTVPTRSNGGGASSTKWQPKKVAGFFKRMPLPAKYGTLGVYHAI